MGSLTCIKYEEDEKNIFWFEGLTAIFHTFEQPSIFESARESGALFFMERERERRSEEKLRARAGAPLGKIGDERERERRSKNQGARNTLHSSTLFAHSN